ncbi:MAG TPA: hypothetical protein VKU89_05040 [Solirubrobacteraceae bacterium]|nr:hypothetical protein [Solirubrobacteraceae bacterium]
MADEKAQVWNPASSAAVAKLLEHPCASELAAAALLLLRDDYGRLEDGQPRWMLSGKTVHGPLSFIGQHALFHQMELIKAAPAPPAGACIAGSSARSRRVHIA